MQSLIVHVQMNLILTEDRLYNEGVINYNITELKQRTRLRYFEELQICAKFK